MSDIARKRHPEVRAQEITAVVLCGGRGSRLGEVDKPMLPVGDRPLVEHVIAALSPQVGSFVLSCGRDAAPYRSLGHQTTIDAHPGDGPLGGITAALPLVESDWILVHPGDAPFADPALVERLAVVAQEDGLAVPRTGDYRQNLVLLLLPSKARALAAFYEQGGRAVWRWLEAIEARSVDMTDVADSFFNVNTADDLATAERRLIPR
jgi:molybdopterin-guanine dinucleotide biosynthesis protein A